MERLTFLNGDEIPCVRNDQCFEEQSEHYCGPAIDRLAAYEDTHMMPPDVMHMRMDMAILTALFDGIDVDRMREIVAAERGGRVVVLPCKVGDTVWFKTYTDNGRTCIGMQPHKVVGTRMCVMAEGGIFPVELLLSRFGESWFLTREEAEKALEGMRNG